MTSTARKAASAISNAWGSALPMSSLARIKIRRAMNLGSSPPSNHAREPIQGGIRIAAPHGFDERADDVVVHIFVLIVRKSSVRRRERHHVGIDAQGFAFGRNALSCALPRKPGRKLQGGQRTTGIAPRKVHHRIERIVRQFEFALQAALVLKSPTNDGSDVLIRESLELNDARTGYQRRIHLEKRILRRGADKHDRAVFHGMKQRVLLASVETVNLVDEKDGAHSVENKPLFGRGDFSAKIGNRAADRGNLDEGGLRAFGDDVRDARFSRSRRAEEDNRRKGIGCDGRKKPASRTNRMLLPCQLIKRARAHANRKRRCRHFRGIVHFGKKIFHRRSSLPLDVTTCSARAHVPMHGL